MSTENAKIKHPKQGGTGTPFQAGCKSPITEFDLNSSETSYVDQPEEKKSKPTRRSTSRGRNPLKPLNVERKSESDHELMENDTEESSSQVEKSENEMEPDMPPKKSKKKKNKKRHEKFFTMENWKEKLSMITYLQLMNVLVFVVIANVLGIPPMSLSVATGLWKHVFGGEWSQPVSIAAPSTMPHSLAVDEIRIDVLRMRAIKTDLIFLNKLAMANPYKDYTVMKISNLEFPKNERVMKNIKYLEGLIAEKKKIEEAVAAAESRKKAEKLSEKQNAIMFKVDTINSSNPETVQLAKAISEIVKSLSILQEQVGEMKQQQKQTEDSEKMGSLDINPIAEMDNEKLGAKSETASTGSGTVRSAGNLSPNQNQMQHGQALVPGAN